MHRCITLAKKGLGSTYPNPFVGSVVVYKNKIIGEGWHQKAGSAHAEVNAIHAVADKELLKHSTLYVNLEPCSHYGKTPPCVNLILHHKIPEVIIGSIDPNPLVAGQGIKKLIDAGCKVSVGILENECNQLNKRFFTYYKKKRPYILLKWASTIDGFIGELNQTIGKPFWISSQMAKQWVHKWRTQEQSILVGTKTVTLDNPQLTSRLWHGNQPTRVIIDQHLTVNPDSAVFNSDSKTIVINAIKNSSENDPSHVIYAQATFNNELPQTICNILYQHKIQSVIIEGGAKTLQTFIDANLWDEARVFTASKTLKKGIQQPSLSKTASKSILLPSETLNIYYND